MSRVERVRGPIVGVVFDDRTHAENARTGGFVHTKCRDVAAEKLAQRAPFIANPKCPLCRPCVAAIEAEVAPC